MEFPFHPCDPNGPRAEQRKVHAPTSTGRCTLRPVPAGWIPQGGGRPRLWRSLVTFWRQKVTPAGRPRRGAGLRLRNRRRTIPPTRRCGLCIPRLAPERRGKSRSRRRTSSPHQTRLRWALAGAPSCRATSLYTREAFGLDRPGRAAPLGRKQHSRVAFFLEICYDIK